MEMTVSEAAERLGISPRAVRFGIQTGRLRAHRRIGDIALLDDRTIEATRRTTRRGRTWNEKTAWAALDLLGDGHTDRIAGSDRSRLKARLKTMTAHRFAHAATGRGRLLRTALHDGTRTAAERLITLSGPSRLTDDATAATFGLAAGGSAITVGYADRDTWERLRRGFLAETSADGDLMLRLTEHPPVVNLATIALDLYELGSTRESARGLAWLEAALRDLRR